MKRLLVVLIVIVLYSCSKNIEPSQIDKIDNSSTPSIDDVSISTDQAAFVANTFFNSKLDQTTKNLNQQREIDSIHPINDESGNPLMYVINFKGRGFALISSTKGYMPILAYSDVSNFDYKEVIKHSGIAKWIEETSYNIKNTDKLGTKEKFKIRNQWMAYEQKDQNNIYGAATKTNDPAGDSFHNRLTLIKEENPEYNFYSLSRVNSSMFPLPTTYDEICNLANSYNSPPYYTIVGIKNNYKETRIGPLLTSKWGQYDEYNALIPNRYAAGCVAIAMAQIRKLF